jgi:chemotaxis signal transduction protein
MSDANLPSASDCDEELKQALAAAFGDEGMDFLDDESDECIPELCCEEEISSSAGSLDAELAAVTVNDDDTSLIRYVKELSRAIYTGGKSTTNDVNSCVSRFVVFAVNDQQFGVPLPAVSEIGRYPKVIELPRTPSWLRGVANLRGQILSVTDLRSLLNVPGEKPAVGEKIIVVHSQTINTSTAIVVDRVLGIRNLECEPGDVSEIKQRFATIASGTARFDQVNTVLIEPDQLFQCAELLLTFAS